MTIYHASSFYQILSCVVHSCKNQEESEKILFYTNSIKQSIHIKVLETFFSKVINIDVRKGFEDLTNYQKNINDYFNALFVNNHLVIDENTSIYSGGSHFNFGTYLAVNHIPFYYMEEACGLFSDPEHVREIDKKNREETDIIDSLGLYDGSCECVLGIICNRNEQKAEYINDKMIHFDVLKEMYQLDISVIQRIMKIFGEADELTVPNDAVIMLSQHYANLGQMTYEGQAYLYGLLFDYFFEDKTIMIKRHPADQMAYEAIYPKVRVIKESFLSEFIPFIMKPIPKMIATVSSTGIYSLRSLFENSMEFDFDFEDVFESLNKVYFAISLLEGLKDVESFSYMGINEKMICNLMKYSGTKHFTVKEIKNIADIKTGDIVIVDRFSDERLSGSNPEEIAHYFNQDCPARLVIFINSDRDYLFYDSLDSQKLFQKLIPITIEKTNLNKNRDYDMYNDFEPETFYLLTGDREIWRAAKKFKGERKLKNLEINLDVAGYETKEQLEIAVLKGIIEANETRLLHYLRRCEVLERELRESKGE